MRVAFYEPPGARTDPSPFDGNSPAALVESALVACGHEVSRIPVRTADEPTSFAADKRHPVDSAEAAWLVGYFRSAQRPPPDLWISSLVSGRAVDRIGPAACAALGIPYILVQPSIPTGGAAACNDGEDPLRRTIAEAAATIVFSSADAESLRQMLPEHGDRLIVLPPFIDLNRVAAVARRRAALRAALSLQHRIRLDVPWLVAAGPMSTDAHLNSFRIVARAAVMASNLDWQMIVAGTGPLRTEVDSLFQGSPHRLDRHIAIATPEDLTAILVCGDLFLWPFAAEEFSPTVLEAQAAGLAVVGPRSSAMLDVVANGQTGMLTKPDNDASFTNAVTFLLRQPDFRRTFAQKAPQWVSTNFDFNVVAPQFNDAIRRVSDAFRSRQPRTPA
jgi:glycosyltransferase involved in cell wall biosynthesis